MRDDLLGVFGNPEETGKPAGDDLREGKRTALIAFAYDRGSAKTKSLIDEKLGTSNIDGLAEAIKDSGAPDHVEDLIEKLAENALDAINREEINSVAKKLMTEMVTVVTKRNR